MLGLSIYIRLDNSIKIYYQNLIQDWRNEAPRYNSLPKLRLGLVVTTARQLQRRFLEVLSCMIAIASGCKKNSTQWRSPH
jgi:hypothetical protein